MMADLQRTLEIFANGYFIEIVGLLGTFFEDSGKTAVKVKKNSTIMIWFLY